MLLISMAFFLACNLSYAIQYAIDLWLKSALLLLSQMTLDFYISSRNVVSRRQTKFQGQSTT